jgi:putative transposase
MLKTIRVMLHPNNQQRSCLFRSAGVARWAYNWALGRERENYANGGSFLSAFDLQRDLTVLKKQPEFAWLNESSRAIAASAIKDATIAYQNFFKGRAKFPRFKSRNKARPAFYLEGRLLDVRPQNVRIAKLSPDRKKGKTFNWVKLAEKNKLPIEGKALSAHVVYDGLNWWVSAVYEFPDSQDTPVGEPIGIDLGIKDLAVCSDGTVYENINRSAEVRRLEKKLHRLQRQLSRKYEMNKDGQKYIKTTNIRKLEKQVLRVQRRLSNIRKNHRHQATAAIVRKQPRMIVMEDLNVSGMMKNRHLAKAIANQGFYEFMRQIAYKSERHNIHFVQADRFYPSSQICSACGARWSGAKNLKIREWVCPVCGASLNRDLNAAINLKNYGLRLA